MKIATLLTAILVWGLFSSCNTSDEKSIPQFSELEIQSQSGGMPNLHFSAKGTLFLSWIEYLNDTTDALVFSKLTNGMWSEPKQIAEGSNWFVNWADFPSMAVYQDDENDLSAHWLQKSAAGKFDYDVRITQSVDGGNNWNPSFIIHTDGIAAEHGFVSMVPLPDGKIFATWLDGRMTKGQDKNAGHTADAHAHKGTMTLRGATFDRSGIVRDEVELDEKTCDCCQTAATLTSKGLLVAYRDRSDTEHRDIYVVRQAEDGTWTKPKAVFEDNWYITSCPVNGPSLASVGETIALAWFTAANGKPAVKLAFSLDGGQTFGLPYLIDDGKPEGRVDVVFVSKEKAIVVWLENVNEEGQIRAVEIRTNGDKGQSFLVATTSLARLSGFPRVEKAGDKLVFAWTEVIGANTKVRTAVMY